MDEVEEEYFVLQILIRTGTPVLPIVYYAIIRKGIEYCEIYAVLVVGEKERRR